MKGPITVAVEQLLQEMLSGCSKTANVLFDQLVPIDAGETAFIKEHATLVPFAEEGKSEAPTSLGVLGVLQGLVGREGNKIVTAHHKATGEWTNFWIGEPRDAVKPSFDPADPGQRKQLVERIEAVAKWLTADGAKLPAGLTTLGKSPHQIATDLDIAAIMIKISTFE